MSIRTVFELKHFEQIVASMQNWLAGVQTRVTDFNVGSVNRTLLEAVAMELEELYYRLVHALDAGIGEAVYSAFSFTQAAAAAATGTVTFSRATPADLNYVIALGTRVATADGVEFQTVATVTLLIGQTSVAASVTAVAAGAAGNVAAGAITVLKTPILGLDAVTNAAATSGGTDEESEGARQTRFQEFIAALARAPINGVLAGAKTAALTDPVTGGIIEQVRQAQLDEPFLTQPNALAGLATLYIDNGAGSASNSLITKCQQVIDGYTDSVTGLPVMGYKAAGVVVTVVAVTPVTQNLAVTVALTALGTQAAVSAGLADVASGLFDALGIGDGLDWERLLAALIAVDGVKTLTLTTPSADVAGQLGKRLRVGTLTVTYL